jgi:hypothetical protein
MFDKYLIWTLTISFSKSKEVLLFNSIIIFKLSIHCNLKAVLVEYNHLLNKFPSISSLGSLKVCLIKNK